jgi:hypothetical protein
MGSVPEPPPGCVVNNELSLSSAVKVRKLLVGLSNLPWREAGPPEYHVKCGLGPVSSFAAGSRANTASSFRAKRGEIERCCGLLPESQRQNLALTVLYVPCSLDSGAGVYVTQCIH